MIKMKDEKLIKILSKYNDNVSKLFKLGDSELNYRLDYIKKYKFNRSDEDIRQLLLLANDKELYNYKFIDSAYAKEFFAVIHAWRALSQMEIFELKDIFIELMSEIKDKNFDDFQVVFFRELISPFRSSMYKEFEKYIKDDSLNEWVRVEYIETLRDMFETDELDFEDTDELFKYILTTNEIEIINAYIIGICKDYKLIQHYDDIKQCFLNNKVDLMCNGDLEDCEVAFGLKEERSEERKISGIASDFSEFLEEIDSIENKNKNEDIEQKVDMIKVGRNDPCPCGSGKKYKKCCLNK